MSGVDETTEYLDEMILDEAIVAAEEATIQAFSELRGGTQ